MYSSLTNSSSSLTKAANSADTLGVWMIISLVVAVVGGIALYFTFLSKKNDGKFNGFLGWLYDTLTFRNMVVEMLLKIFYLVLAIFITLYSLGLIAVNILLCLGFLIFGNLFVRIAYELVLISIINCRNTTEINKKLNKMMPKEETEVEKPE
jgi:hypothetical protein